MSSLAQPLRSAGEMKPTGGMAPMEEEEEEEEEGQALHTEMCH